MTVYDPAPCKGRCLGGQDNHVSLLAASHSAFYPTCGKETSPHAKEQRRLVQPVPL